MKCTYSGVRGSWVAFAFFCGVFLSSWFAFSLAFVASMVLHNFGECQRLPDTGSAKDPRALITISFAVIVVRCGWGGMMADFVGKGCWVTEGQRLDGKEGH
jgi:hypothetical protein